MSKRPRQLFYFVIEMDVDGVGPVQRKLIFDEYPTREQMLEAVLLQNEYYSDHFHMNDIVWNTVRHLPNDCFEHMSRSGWHRRLPESRLRDSIKVSMTSEDFFPAVDL